MPRQPILELNNDALEVNLKPVMGTSDFSDMLLKIKSVSGATFDWDRKVWRIPADPQKAEQLILSLDPKCDDEIRSWAREARIKQAEELTSPLPEDAELLIPWAVTRAPWQPHFIEIGGEREAFHGLMQHQRPVVELVARQRKLLIADDMGLGKTGEAISGIEEWRHRNELGDGVTLPEGPRLVICPNSVKGSWARELRDVWLNDPNLQIVDATTPAARENQLVKAIAEDAWIIVNWEQIRTRKEKIKLRNGGSKTVTVMKQPLFETTKWLAVVADEIHRAKNRKAAQTQGLWRIRADDGVMLGLSGTPLMNSPDELWSLLHWLWPKEYTSYWRFYDQYVEYYESHFGRVITGVKNPDDLRWHLRGRLVRRTKGQVLNLPGKMRVPVPLTLNPKQRKLYEEAERAMWLQVIQDAEEGDTSAQKFARAAVEGGLDKTALYRIQNGASRTVRLRQIVETPACLGGPDDSAVLDNCVERILDSQPKQWIVFCEFKPTVQCLIDRLTKAGLTAERYTGDVDSEDRTTLEDRFQRGEIDVLVGTIDAMREGITLTASDTQFWVSRDWVPDNNEQGESRQDRIGQKNKVTIYIAAPENTVSTTKVEPTNRFKEHIVRSVLPKDEIEEAASA